MFGTITPVGEYVAYGPVVSTTMAHVKVGFVWSALVVSSTESHTGSALGEVGSQVTRPWLVRLMLKVRP